MYIEYIFAIQQLKFVLNKFLLKNSGEKFDIDVLCNKYVAHVTAFQCGIKPWFLSVSKRLFLVFATDVVRNLCIQYSKLRIICCLFVTALWP